MNNATIPKENHVLFNKNFKGFLKTLPSSGLHLLFFLNIYEKI